jgi:hypothetical protein
MLKVFMLILVTPIVVQGSTPHQAYMREYLPLVTAHLEADYPGPLARDLGSMALARQILEDGMHKGPRYSVAGIGVGSPNREIVQQHIFPWLKVGKATDYEGGTFYSFTGPQASVCSAVLIARLFDSYIPRFMKRNETQWDLIKDLSSHVADTGCVGLAETYQALNPGDLIRRANRMYGPQSEAVEHINDSH